MHNLMKLVWYFLDVNSNREITLWTLHLLCSCLLLTSISERHTKQTEWQHSHSLDRSIAVFDDCRIACSWLSKCFSYWQHFMMEWNVWWLLEQGLERENYGLVGSGICLWIFVMVDIFMGLKGEQLCFRATTGPKPCPRASFERTKQQENKEIRPPVITFMPHTMLQTAL